MERSMRTLVATGLISILGACTSEPEDTGTAPSVVDADGDGFTSRYDCNDSDPSIHPGATEICDDLDNDCDDLVDEGRQKIDDKA